MKVILHIGQAKTGTSAIQSFLASNRTALLRQGAVFPDITLNGLRLDLHNHNALVDALTGRMVYPYLRADDYWAQVFAAADKHGANTIILSAEHFFGGEPRVWNVANETEYYARYGKKLDVLRMRLKECDVKVIVYLRNQVDWLASSIAHTVRFQLLHAIKDVYQSDQQYFEMVRPLLRYGRLLDCWAAIFGRSAITAAPYDANELQDGNSSVDFAARAGLNAAALKHQVMPAAANPSLSAEFVEVKKILNRQPKSKDRERVVIDCLDRLTRQAMPHKAYRISDALAREVCDYVAADNEYLNETYLVPGRPLCLSAATSLAAEFPKPEDIDRAMQRYLREARHPRYALKFAETRAKSLLRDHATPLHAVLRQGKRITHALLR